MFFKTRAVVLREVDYKDNDRILTLLTEDRGLLTVKARGVKSKSSKLKVACQLFAFSVLLGPPCTVSFTLSTSHLQLSRENLIAPLF